MFEDYLLSLPKPLREGIIKYFKDYGIGLPKVFVPNLRVFKYVLADYSRFGYVRSILDILKDCRTVYDIDVQRIKDLNESEYSEVNT